MANYLEVDTTDKLITNNEVVEVGAADSMVIRQSKPIPVGGNDSYVLTPYQSATSIDYTVPQSILEGLSDVGQLRADLLDEVNARELAIVDTTAYINTTADAAKTQTLLEVNANYVSNNGSGGIEDAYILNTDFSNATVSTTFDAFGNGLSAATMQEVSDKIISVENSNASYTDTVDALVTGDNSYIQRTTDLEAAVGSVSVGIVGGDTIDVNGGGYTASASKVITDNTTGAITGWVAAQENIDGVLKSDMIIQADNFKITAASQTADWSDSFSIEAGSPNKIKFDGVVSFGNAQTGTIEQAISSTVSTVAVGDKNINITDNLTPTTSLVGDTNNAGYQFIGDPIKSVEAGMDTYSEPQIELDADDEVYSPYVDEVINSFYYRFGIKNTTDFSEFRIIDIEGVIPTSKGIAVVLDSGIVIDNSQWYIVDGLINPETGDDTGTNGSIRMPDGTKIGTVQNVKMTAGTEWVTLGWTGDAVISRMKIAKITADTQTGAVASVDYVESVAEDIYNTGYVLPEGVATAINFNSTTIDGSKITTGTINADSIAANSITANEIATNSITTSELNIDTLSAITTNTGTLSIDTNGYIKSGQSGYNSGVGFWLGDVSGTTKMSIGNSSGNNIRWDGTNLTLTGEIIQTGNIADEAVTKIARYSDSSTYTIPNENSWNTFGSLTITVAAGEVVDLTTMFTSSKGSNIAAISLRILRGSTTIYGTNTIGGNQDSLFANCMDYANSWRNNSLFVSDTPGTGTFTYYAQCGTHARHSTPYQAVRQRYMRAEIFKK